MMQENEFEVIIIGGSFSGLSAAMSLGRSLRKTLILDTGLPCNRFTPHSHNFLLHDGDSPEALLSKARKQVIMYPSVQFENEEAVNVSKTSNGFEISTASKKMYTAPKIILATGVKDILLEIPGFADCWGKSILHCPYCHGYEYRHQKTAILGNGDFAFEFCKLIAQWTADLSLLTNGKPSLDESQIQWLKENKIKIYEDELLHVRHSNGFLSEVWLSNNTTLPFSAIYARLPMNQTNQIPQLLGCEMTDFGHIKTDMFQKSSVEGVFACGDNSSMMRSIANAVATGQIAGAVANKELADEIFFNKHKASIVK